MSGESQSLIKTTLCGLGGNQAGNKGQQRQLVILKSFSCAHNHDPKQVAGENRLIHTQSRENSSKVLQCNASVTGASQKHGVQQSKKKSLERPISQSSLGQKKEFVGGCGWVKSKRTRWPILPALRTQVFERRLYRELAGTRRQDFSSASRFGRVIAGGRVVDPFYRKFCCMHRHRSCASPPESNKTVLLRDVLRH